MTYNKMGLFSNEFKSFIIDNNILTSMAAVTIAFSTGIMVRSFVGDILLPSIYGLFVSRFAVANGAFAPISKLNLDNFLKELVSFIFVVIIVYVIVYYVFKKWLLRIENKASSNASASLVQPPKKEKDGSNTASAVVGGDTFYSPPTVMYYPSY